MAKDTPVEPLYDQMFGCARHVDWYVTDTLCRWADSEWAEVVRDDEKWIRWDELLGFFLRAPIDSPPGTVRRSSIRRFPSAVRYTVTSDDDTLSSVYQRVSRSLMPDQMIRPYEEMIMANLTNTDISAFSSVLRPPDT